MSFDIEYLQMSDLLKDCLDVNVPSFQQQFVGEFPTEYNTNASTVFDENKKSVIDGMMETLNYMKERKHRIIDHEEDMLIFKESLLRALGIDDPVVNRDIVPDELFDMEK